MLGLPQRKATLARGNNDTIRMIQDGISGIGYKMRGHVPSYSPNSEAVSAILEQPFTKAARLVPTRWILACLAALFVAAPASAQMVEARDLAADARLAAEHKIPLLVLFSEAGCPYCERARLEFLLPMQRNPEYQTKVMMREVGIDSTAVLVDFAGNRTTQAEFARRQRVTMMPTVMLLGPRGEALAEPLVGFRGADYYGYFLDQRIDAALAQLRDTR